MKTQRAKMINLITQQMNAGKFKSAEANLKLALARFPRDFAFLSYMGIVQVNKNQGKEAVSFFKKALKIMPKSHEALRNLGSAQTMVGDYSAAISNHMKALKINPRFDQGWFALGKTHLARENFEPALQAFEKSFRINPKYVVAAAEWLNVLERNNKTDALREAVADVARHLPDHPVTKLFQGVVLVRDKDFAAAKTLLESFSFADLGNADMMSFELTRIRNLGRCCDSLHQEQEAFSYFERAKAFNRELYRGRYADPARYRDLLEMRQTYYSAFDPATWQPQSEATESPIFMVGFPRSGTTLLDTFLRGNKGVSVMEEKRTVYALRQELGTLEIGDLGLLEHLDADTLKRARKAYFKAVRAENAHGTVIDKLPLNLALAGEILRVFPKARFILVLRDPADSVLSNFMQTYRLNASMATLENPLEAAKTYDSVMQIWQSTVEKLAPDVVISRYEDLISDPEKTLRPVSEFIGIDWDASVLDHRQTASTRERISTPSYSQVVQPLYKTAVARWERYEHLMPEAMEILQPWRKTFGYCD